MNKRNAEESKLALLNEYCALTGRPDTTWGSVDIMGFYLWMESSRSMKGRP